MTGGYGDSSSHYHFNLLVCVVSEHWSMVWRRESTNDSAQSKYRRSYIIDRLLVFMDIERMCITRC